MKNSWLTSKTIGAESCDPAPACLTPTYRQGTPLFWVSLLFIIIIREAQKYVNPLEKICPGIQSRPSLFFRPYGLRRFKVSLHNPPESSVKQCVLAHSFASTLWQTHAAACRYLYHRTRRWPLSNPLRRQPQFSAQNAAGNWRPKGAKPQAPLVVQPRRKACSPEAPAPWPGFGAVPNQRIGISEKDIPIHCWPIHQSVKGQKTKNF